MKLVVFGKGERGARCLDALHCAGHEIALAVGQGSGAESAGSGLAETARALGYPLYQPEDPNAPEARVALAELKADLFVLAGYGKILKRAALGIPRRGCINLHAGKLPEYRGSSPLNWALINGERSFTLSIIQVDPGIDTGALLAERSFPIGPDDTIRELHAIANEQFPEMLLEVIEAIEVGISATRPQLEGGGSYWPLRLPEDGAVLFDTYTAAQVHDRIRALADPYPGAFTLWKGRTVKLLASRRCEDDYRGEPGRVYRISRGGLLVCASDRCLWLERALLADTGRPLADEIARYDRLATVREAALQALLTGAPPLGLRPTNR
jgi:methionyl-tRNA formyltransferase